MTQAVGEIGFCLPQERGHVVEVGAFAAALEVDKPRLPVFYHHVARLEVAVHECRRLRPHEHFGQGLEIVFEAIFGKFEAGGFEKAVFEIVEVPHYRAGVELRRRVAFGEVHAHGSHKLYVGEQADSVGKKPAFVGGERAGESSFLDGTEQQRVAKVFLKIRHAVVGYGHHARHGYVVLEEMVGHVEERFVFLEACAHHADKRGGAFETEITAV